MVSRGWNSANQVSAGLGSASTLLTDIGNLDAASRSGGRVVNWNTHIRHNQMEKQIDHFQSKKDSPNTFVDISDLLLNYARDFQLPKNISDRINWKDLRASDIDYSRLRITNKPTTHSPLYDPEGRSLMNGSVVDGPLLQTKSELPGNKKAKSHILFSSVFSNSTSETQTNHLRTERRTSSSCRISVSKAVSREGEFSLQIGPPGTLVQANGGFRHEVQMSRDKERVFEEELVWSLESEVVVPPGYQTRAELVITEDEYDGKFRVETIFEGSAAIHLRDKKDGSVIYTIIAGDLSRIFTPEYGFYKIPDQPRAVGFTNEGQCHCNFGVGQKVELYQEKIKT
ncbi:unnamed protein product [Calicophoron daubneyi]|uniref:Uncharacterized protein n=1 Tax=Calicophoron daubneyi TaxID=300641 RepID=A0AAV2TDC6_CALDB